MPKDTDITIKSVQNSTAYLAYRQPLKFGETVVEDATILRAEVEVALRGIRRKIVGIGEMSMGTAWAWPGRISSTITLKVVLELANRLAQRVSDAKLMGDPLQLTHRINALRDAIATELEAEYKIVDGIPRLAVMLAGSPLEAAVHDAFGRAHERSSFELLSAEFLNEDLSAYLGEDFAGKYPSEYVLAKPRPTLPLYHLVGALDPLSTDDLKVRLNDGYPETLEQWLRIEGISHLKLKLAGNNLDWDVGRIVEVTRICEAVASERNWKLSFDFNALCPDEDYVIELLERLERLSPLSHSRLQYIEQPTPRDLTIRTDMTVNRVSRFYPIVIDESLDGMESLRLARKRGYTGIALKTCKGHTECLLMAAAAKAYKMFLSVQDLTCIGGSFLHTVALASRLPQVAAVEGHGRQYCPAGNQAYTNKYAPLFRVRYGTIPTELLSGIGLGFEWQKLPKPAPEEPKPLLKPAPPKPAKVAVTVKRAVKEKPVAKKPAPQPKTAKKPLPAPASSKKKPHSKPAAKPAPAKVALAKKKPAKKK